MYRTVGEEEQYASCAQWHAPKADNILHVVIGSWNYNSILCRALRRAERPCANPAPKSVRRRQMLVRTKMERAIMITHPTVFVC